MSTICNYCYQGERYFYTITMKKSSFKYGYQTPLRQVATVVMKKLSSTFMNLATSVDWNPSSVMKLSLALTSRRRLTSTP
jgi:hypothetical protein